MNNQHHQESIPQNLRELRRLLFAFGCVLLIAASVLGGLFSIMALSGASEEMLRELMLIRSILLGYVGAKGLRLAVRIGRD